MAGTDIPIQLPPIRSVVCTLGVYQDHKTSGGHTQIPMTEGHPNHGSITHSGKRADTTASSNNVFQVVGEAKPCSPGHTPAPLFYRNLQLCLHRALQGTAGGRDYTAHTQLTPAARQELCWRQEHLTRWNGCYLLGRRPNMVIETDASTTG